jgi:hypothetical protein
LDHQSWTQALGYPGCFQSLIQVTADGGTTDYIGCLSGLGLYSSHDGQNWSSVPNGISAGALIAKGSYLYALAGFDTTGEPIWRAPLSDVTNWTHVTALDVAARISSSSSDAGNLAYDSSHQLLYVSTINGGLWRVVTP